MSIQRFTQWCAVSHRHDLSKVETGEWVRYTDHEAELAGLLANIDQAREELACGTESLRTVEAQLDHIIRRLVRKEKCADEREAALARTEEP